MSKIKTKTKTQGLKTKVKTKTQSFKTQTKTLKTEPWDVLTARLKNHNSGI